MNFKALCPCEVEGLIDATGFWEWNFNDNFPCNIVVTKAVCGYFKGQENFLGDFWHRKKSWKKLWHPNIKRSEFKWCLRITLKFWAQKINWENKMMDS